MKKLFCFSILLSAILISCSKEEIFQTLKIHTSQYSSRSTFENNTTSWCEGDYLSVLFSDNDADCGTYTFNISGDPKVGVFECTEANLDLSATYDIYALHQASATIAGAEATINIGSPTQTQEALTSSHIAQHDPLYGTAMGVSIDKMSVNLNHLASVLTFKISNGLSVPMEIASVTISTSNHSKLCGTYSLNLKSGELSETSTSESITLNIANAPTLEVGNDMQLWIATAPFFLAQGESLNFTITTSDGVEYIHPQTMGGEVAFAAGKIKSMKQVIELSESKLLPATKTVVYDFTNASNYPADFPLESNWKNENIDKELTYDFADHKLTIKSDVKFYHYSNSAGTTHYLQFIHKDESKKSLIYLPMGQYGKYKITDVYVECNAPSSKYGFAITDKDGNIIGDNKNLLSPSTNKTVTIKDKPTTAEIQYCLMIKPKSSSTTDVKCNINSITINYKLENNTP